MNEKHYRIILLKGVENWNLWRKKNHFIPDLSRADLSGVFLNNANFVMVDLNEVNLSYADLEQVNLEDANLSGSNLSKANLRFANLINADLSGANLGNANLDHANLCGANISKANLSGANLNYANLSGANLSKINLSNATLTCTNFTGAYLKNSIFKFSDLIETLFCNVDLSSAKNLHECNHWGPSIIDIRTLQKSGDLPVEFLRGVGLSDNMIDNYTSLLLEKIIKFYSCFISYSAKDKEFAEYIHDDLQNKGIRCWLLPREIEGGNKLHYQINKEIKKGKLLLILSETSINSKWIMSEIKIAREEEILNKEQKLFPLRLVNKNVMKKWECFDSSTNVDLAEKIREYYIHDFSSWKTDSEIYKKGFSKLLTDLKSPG